MERSQGLPDRVSAPLRASVHTRLLRPGDSITDLATGRTQRIVPCLAVQQRKQDCVRAVVETPDHPNQPSSVPADPNGGESPRRSGITRDPATETPSRLPERIVALSEEFLLADLLSLGVTPVASTSNDPGGFVGIDPSLTEGVEAIFSPEFNLERLAALRPDLLLVYPSYLALDVVSTSDLEAIAPVLVLGDEGDDWRTTFRATAAALGLSARGDEILADVDARLASAGDALNGIRLSAVSISPGPTIRAYTDGRTALTEILVELGIEFRPGPSVGGTDDNGRITLSLEQLSLLDGDALLLLQSDVVPGEADALADVQSSPLWSALPAVAAGAVVTLDRLSYPGAEGAARFADDLAAALV
jgi:iron complex transport system substrate-binding protein